MLLDEKKSAAARPRVTVFCGFLGAGKTTLLSHLLGQAEGRRWGAIVNDVAAINIDAAEVVAGATGERLGARGDGGKDKTVLPAEGAMAEVRALGNGCVCCSAKDELGETLAEMAATGGFEHIWVETTGVAEPRGVANLFLRKNPFGRTLSDFAELAALVSVVDAAHFLGEWKKDQAKTRREAGGAERPVFELMLEQVECADVLVLNKCDLVNAEELAQVEGILRGLNERAELVRTERGQIASEFWLGRVRFDAKATMGAARWVRLMNQAGEGRGVMGEGDGGEASGSQRVTRRPGWSLAVPGRGETSAQGAAGARQAKHEERFGIRSFVFQARRPFVREKFFAWLARPCAGLLRAKGYFWLAEQPDEMGFLSVAGGVLRYDFPGYWWAAMIENGRARREEVPGVLEKIWDEKTGDRRQELVFIGVGLDEAAMRAELEGCLRE